MILLVEQWNSRTHFCTESVGNLDNWIPDLFNQWPTILDQIELKVNENTVSVQRLDGRWPWMQPIDEVLGSTTLFPVTDFGDGCTPSTLPLNGSIALVSNLQGSTCYWSEKFINAERAGAVGVVVYADEGESIIDINCRKISCYLTLIPVTMTTHDVGEFVISTLSSGTDVTMKVSISPVIIIIVNEF